MSFQDFWLPPLLCLPLIGANMLAVVWGRGAQPLEHYSWWPQSIRLGTSKTLRGFVGGVLTGVLLSRALVIFIVVVSGNRQLIHLWEFNSWQSWIIMLAMASGALIGDLVESAYKRSRQMPSGHSFWPWDQLDAIIGGFLMVALVNWQWFYLNLVLRWQVTVIWVIIYLLVHPLFSLAAYLGKLKSHPH